MKLPPESGEKLDRPHRRCVREDEGSDPGGRRDYEHLFLVRSPAEWTGCNRLVRCGFEAVTAETVLAGQAMPRGPQHTAVTPGEGHLVDPHQLHVLVQDGLASYMAVNYSAVGTFDV